MTTSSPELSEMADIFPSEGWTDKQDQQAALRPHAQAHLLSSTENCKVGAWCDPVLLSASVPTRHQGYLSDSSARPNRNLINLFHF